MQTTPPKPLLITTGEPAGIGMDIVIDTLAHHAHALPTPLIICADKHAFAERVAQLQKQGKTQTDILADMTVMDDIGGIDPSDPRPIYLLHVPCFAPVVAGVLNADNARMVKAQLDIAHTLATTRQIRAIITAPLQKSVMIDGGVCLDNGDKFSGHTEYFMHKAGVDKVVMMLANAKMKVALVTTHIPLKDVPSAITPQEIRQTVQITHDVMVHKFGITCPKILVCGLNPHAGEDGHLGDEELMVINPVLHDFRKNGMDISLAMPADTLFTERHLAVADAVIAMYHDQGLAPLKSHGFGDTVNITLGLPYVRTSVDHGTALDLAGTGQASSSSLRRAIEMAVMMSGGV
ncbi:4-hydroxythreonine-4-phosphate dehydrogenase 1 [Moraxella caprae]|uniref:4-hydroxythreonine-4-phosphate dehydrogenase 1 n=1 Tax=Moraxella caprae TaxID=90240 RepID=A0A378R0I5_9GAMM|nr:4-hydroxythreonine-4-phosphate dehydrogenase PdxA [Moraxella caprae]STZ08803.1 4-hydroxythreonine-4-phosphate dehydrogenase 1 [Moraxella caprae]